MINVAGIWCLLMRSWARDLSVRGRGPKSSLNTNLEAAGRPLTSAVLP